MILIINQHRGSMDELVAHIENYLEKITTYNDLFYMSLTVDQEVTKEDRDRLLKYAGSRSMQINFGPGNRGIQRARMESFVTGKLYLESIGESLDGVIWGCTNSKWIRSLTKSLYLDLKSNLKSHPILLIPCKYDEFPHERVSFNSRKITFGQYLSEPFKDDYTLVTRTLPDYNLMAPFDDEKYYPEDAILSHLIGKYEYMKIYSEPLQKAWYNSKGLTKSFNRQFMVDNGKGFQDRARLILDKFISGDVELGYDRIKNYCSEFVTLGDEMDMKRYSGTILEPILWECLKKWSTNVDFNHSIKFNEHVK